MFDNADSRMLTQLCKTCSELADHIEQVLAVLWKIHMCLWGLMGINIALAVLLVWK